MKLQELIEELERLEEQQGNLDVTVAMQCQGRILTSTDVMVRVGVRNRNLKKNKVNPHELWIGDWR